MGNNVFLNQFFFSNCRNRRRWNRTTADQTLQILKAHEALPAGPAGTDAAAHGRHQGRQASVCSLRFRGEGRRHGKQEDAQRRPCRFYQRGDLC